MNTAIALVLGLLTGWLVEWIIDWFYWRRPRDKTRTPGFPRPRLFPLRRAIPHLKTRCNCRRTMPTT